MLLTWFGRQICSQCFVFKLQARLKAPYTPDSQHTDYMAAELSEIFSYCGPVNNAYTLSPDATYTSYTAVNYTSTISVSTTPAAATTCAGQTIPTTAIDATTFQDKRQLLDGSTTNANVSALCETLAVSYQVITGDLVIASGNNDCVFNRTLCLPQTCELLRFYISPRRRWYYIQFRDFHSLGNYTDTDADRRNRQLR